MSERYEHSRLPSVGKDGSTSSLLSEAGPSIGCDGSLYWRLNKIDDCRTNDDQGNRAGETTKSSCALYKRLISDDSARTTDTMESDHSLSTTVPAGSSYIPTKEKISERKVRLILRERSQPHHRCPLVNGSLTGIVRLSRYSSHDVNITSTSTHFPPKPACNCLNLRCVVSFSPKMEVHEFEHESACWDTSSDTSYD